VSAGSSSVAAYSIQRCRVGRDAGWSRRPRLVKTRRHRKRHRQRVRRSARISRFCNGAERRPLSWRSLVIRPMTTRKKPSRDKRAKMLPIPKGGQAIAGRSARRGVPEEDLQGPPARETTLMHDDRERAVQAHLKDYHDTSPRLTGGDPDADWERADHVGEEAVGGTVATPDQSVVDELGGALGVPRAPDEELRTSGRAAAGRGLQGGGAPPAAGVAERANQPAPAASRQLSRGPSVGTARRGGGRPRRWNVGPLAPRAGSSADGDHRPRADRADL